jgi:hypothetical protein
MGIVKKPSFILFAIAPGRFREAPAKKSCHAPKRISFHAAALLRLTITPASA